MAVVVYFSRAGENYVDGDYVSLATGNTARMAQQIAEKVQCECLSIEPLQAYPDAYQETVTLAKEQKETQARPEIKPLSLPETGQDLYLGYPIWWGEPPMPVLSWLESVDTAGISIHPFATHEGSGMGNSMASLKAACPKAILTPGLAVRGSRVDKAARAISDWLATTRSQMTK